MVDYYLGQVFFVKMARIAYFYTIRFAIKLYKKSGEYFGE